VINFTATFDIDSGFQRTLISVLKQKAYSFATAISRHFAKNKIREVLTRRGSGKTYRSKTGSGLHRASAPGEPPSPDTYRYVNSWDTQVVTKADGSVEAQAGTPLWDVFGRRLELGGRDKRGIYIAPRPHVRVIFENATVEIERDIARLNAGETV
jgi:hypothetical protein